MKSTLLSLTLAAAALFVVAAPAEAQTRFHFSHGGGYHGGHHGGHIHRPSHRPSHHSGYVHPSYSHGRSSGHCAPVPVHRVGTSEINRYRQPVTAYMPCGRPYTRWVTVVTYRDHFSNGTWRDYTRTFS